MQTKILIASDHAGYALKKSLMDINPSLFWQDLGPSDETSVDYPDFADFVAKGIPNVVQPENHLHPTVGVLICGSGQGMAIRANRYKHIRAALCWNAEIAKLSREHNNANVLCLGSRFTNPKLATEILTAFLNTPFEGGRHERRVTKLSQNC